MALLAKSDGGTTYKPHPAGWARLVCADVHDEGIQNDEYKGEPRRRHVIRIVFQSEVLNEETGEPYEHSEWLTLSLGEKANLRKMLESWRGKAFTEDDLVNGFDVERLVGVNAYVQFIHKPKQNGGTKAVMASIGKLPPGTQPLAVSASFKPIKDRTKSNGAPPVQQKQPEPPPPEESFGLEEEEDDLPF